MCDRGRKLAERGHSFRAGHELVRLFQFLGLFFRALFQGSSPGHDLVVRFFEIHRHVVERLGHFSKFVVRAHGQAVAQIALSDFSGSSDQLAHAPVHHAPGKQQSEHADQRQREQRSPQDLRLALSGPRIDVCEREMRVDDAQDALALRMRMAGGVPTRWFILNRPDHAKHALTIEREGAGAVPAVELRQRLITLVASEQASICLSTTDPFPSRQLRS